MKKYIALMLALLVALSVAACGQTQEETEKTEEDIPVTETAEQPEEKPAEEPEAEAPEQHDDTLVIAIESEPTTLNPYDHAAVTSGYMNHMTYNRLFRIDLETLEPVPDLVESYANIDETTWTFTIRKGVKFHDGSEMTAEDVKASLAYARNFTSSNKYTAFWTAVDILDTYTVQMTTDGPYALILNDLATNGNTILPKALIDAGNDFNANPVGSGPYIFKHWELGDSLTFVKNEHYFDLSHQPSITEITWRVIPEGPSRTIGLETGEIDMVVDVDTADIERIKKNEHLSVVEKAGTRMNFMGINTERAPFDNLLFRKAISAAIDKEAVLLVATNGQGALSMSPNPEVFQGVTRENTVPYDEEAAKQYLAQSGVDLTEAAFTCIAYTDTTRRTAEVIQGYLQKIGIEMTIENMDFAAYLENMLEGNFDAVIGGYTAGDPLTYMKSLWHSASIGASNVPRVNDPEIDALIDLANTQLDPDARTATLEQVCSMVNEKCLMVSLYTSSVVRAYDSRLQGADVSASGAMLYQDLRWE